MPDNNIQTIQNFPTEFQAQSLELIRRLIPAESLRFSLVDPHMDLKGWVGSNMAIEVEQRYQKHYWHLDPMHPQNFRNSPETVVCSHKMMPQKKWLQSILYQDFLKPMGILHDVDMFFRSETEIVAILTILRTDSQGEFSDAELELLENLQPYMEYALNTSYLPARFEERQSAQDKYQMTVRELDVLEFAMSGANNKIIAQQLGLSLPTVRTHLQHIFKKAKVHSTSELIAKIYRELGFIPRLGGEI